MHNFPVLEISKPPFYVFGTPRMMTFRPFENKWDLSFSLLALLSSWFPQMLKNTWSLNNLIEAVVCAILNNKTLQIAILNYIYDQSEFNSKY